jgi:hypothetical protein
MRFMWPRRTRGYRSRFRGRLICGVAYRRTALPLAHTSLGVARPCACVSRQGPLEGSSRRHPLQIPPPQFRGSCQCVGGLVSFKSLSRGRVGGGSSRSRMSRVACVAYSNVWPKCNQCVVAPPVPAHRSWAPLALQRRHVTLHEERSPLNLEMTRRDHHGTRFLRQFSFLESCVGHVALAGADGAHG